MDRCNSIVLSWLLNSVSPDLFLGQIFSDNASDVWAELKETYDKLDGYIILSLLQKIHNFKQGELTVSEYYRRLNSLWREFDIMTKLPKCSCAAREDVSKHHQLMRLMQFLMGLNDVYQPIRSSLLSRETLPDVKEAFAIISREECFDIIGYPRGYNRNSSRPGVKSTFTANVEVNQTNQTSTQSSPSLSLSNEQIMKLMSLINDMPSRSVQANMAGRASFLNHNVFFNINFHKFFNSNIVLVNISIGWIIDSGANQHMTITTKNMFGIVDISDLNLTVGHPKRTLAKIKYVGNLQLSKDVILYVVLVVPEYCVSLLSVNKLIRDSRLFVGFDESKCYIQDLIQNKIVGTGSESGGLYMFDQSSSHNIGNSMNISAYVSKTLWHTRLGHPADQVLSVLHKDLQMSKGSRVSLYDTCHGAKQTREPFPLSEHKTYTVGDLIHLDLWGPHKVTIKNAYKLYSLDDKTIFYSRDVEFYENVFPFKMNSKLSCDSDSKLSKGNLLNKLIFFDSFDIQNSKTPYDEERATPNDEGSAPNSPNTPRSVSGGGTTTFMGDKSISEGNSHNTQSVLYFQDPIDVGLNVPITDVSFENTDEVQHVVATRKSNRQTKLPAKFNDYVVNSSKKYRLEKVVNYSNLSSGNCCFSTSLNKSAEPSTFYEAIKDRNWIDAMSAEIAALNRNNTWTITTLPKGRKAIGSKWVYKIKYKSTGNIDRYKVRLVAKGFGQKEVSPVVKMTTDVYMTLHPGFSSNNDKVVCSGDTYVALLVYVDDIVITGSDIKQIDDFKHYLKILHEFGLLAAKPVLSPLPANFVLNHIESNEDKALTNVSNYQKLFSKHIYLTHTRPDISYSVHCLSQHMHSPLAYHLKRALRVLRYLKGSPSCGVQVNKTESFDVKVYTDSDKARCPITRKYVSGLCDFLGDSLNMFRVEMFCDNISALQLAANPVFHEKSKHFEIDLHLIREKGSFLDCLKVVSKLVPSTRVSLSIVYSCKVDLEGCFVKSV
ncbi:ribonuclease H-like domain-containing protein [Tanacetum coccineum]